MVREPILSILLLFSFLLLWSSCQPSDESDKATVKPETPAKLLSEEEMADILLDIHVVEGIVQEKGLRGREKREALDGYYLQIYATYGLTDSILLKNYEYYSSQPVVMNRIYQEIINELKIMEGELQESGTE